MEEPKPMEFVYHAKGKGVRASPAQLSTLNRIPGALYRALIETDKDMKQVDADVAFEHLYQYAQAGVFTPRQKRVVK